MSVFVLLVVWMVVGEFLCGWFCFGVFVWVFLCGCFWWVFFVGVFVGDRMYV